MYVRWSNWKPVCVCAHIFSVASVSFCWFLRFILFHRCFLFIQYYKHERRQNEVWNIKHNKCGERKTEKDTVVVATAAVATITAINFHDSLIRWYSSFDVCSFILPRAFIIHCLHLFLLLYSSRLAMFSSFFACKCCYFTTVLLIIVIIGISFFSRMREKTTITYSH